MTLRSETRRPCPYCKGRGYNVLAADGGGATDGVFSYELPCGECDGLGERVTTYFDAGDGITMRVSGSAPLSDESAAALEAVGRAALAQMDALPGEQS